MRHLLLAMNVAVLASACGDKHTVDPALHQLCQSVLDKFDMQSPAFMAECERTDALFVRCVLVMKPDDAWQDQSCRTGVGPDGPDKAARLMKLVVSGQPTP